MTDDIKDKASASAPAASAPSRRLTEKPPRGTVWAHQPGCTNTANAIGEDDWNCPCGPEVVKG